MRKDRKGSRYLAVACSMILTMMVIAGAGGGMTMMPGRSFKGALPPLSAEGTVLRDRLRRHVTVLAGEIGERNVYHYPALERGAQYIEEELRAQGLSVASDEYEVQGKGVRNIEAELKGSRPREIVVVGAHYDSVAGSPGANDNGSGVAALLELARLLRGMKPARTVRLVAFVNEEPPWFMTEEMGSLVYARGCKKRGDKVVGMISLETIGYYSDARNSQRYPAPFNLLYPDTGDFIGMVGNLGSASLLRRVIGAFRRSALFPSEGLAAPSLVEGVGWSDHWSFWQEGYPAVMITDTALFRYPYYHEGGDTPEKLDYGRMARVTAGVERVVRELAGG